MSPFPPPPFWRNPPSIRIAWTVNGQCPILASFARFLKSNGEPSKFIYKQFKHIQQYQSAYRKFHSTKTALLKIHSNILASMAAGKVTALTLFDLSAAFDTIDHTILLRRLDDWFGVTVEALDWFKSYLTGGCQKTRLGDCLSSKADLKFGGRQGLVSCPLLFTLYTTPLSGMTSGHAIPQHLFADNSQLYVSFASGDSAEALNGLQSCLASVQSWMLTSKLKLNPDTTEFILIRNEWQLSKYLSMFPIELFGV